MDDSRGLYFWLWQVDRDGKYDGTDPRGLLEGSGHQTVSFMRGASGGQYVWVKWDFRYFVVERMSGRNE